jgi:hypothetical protein
MTVVNRSVDKFGKRTGGEDGCSNPGKERRKPRWGWARTVRTVRTKFGNDIISTYINIYQLMAMET